MNRLTQAEALLQELGVTEPKEIDLEPIAWHVGVQIRYRPLEGCEAQIIGINDRAIVTVNFDSHPLRKRFSVAHELGHWHYHRGQSSLCSAADIDNSDDKVRAVLRERTADRYASELLMPEYLFRPRAEAGGSVTIKLADSLSRDFTTSLTATAMRLTDLGLGCSMLVCHSQVGRRWFKRGMRVPDTWRPRAELDSRSSAFRVVYGDVTRTSRTLVSAELWFAGRAAAMHELYEESLRISSDHVITLLVFKSSSLGS